MKTRLAWCLAFACGGMATEPALAATSLAQRQIVVQGNQNFDATGINDSGTIIGTLYAAITGTPSGVMLDKQTVSVIPPPYAGGGPAFPRSIDDQGTIVGWADAILNLPTVFVSRNGVVDPSYEIRLEDPNVFSASTLINPIGLVGTELFFTHLLDRDLPSLAEYGTPPNFQTVPRLNRFTTIEGLSLAGMASGTAYTFSGPQRVFLGKDAQFQLLLPPGATSSSGGLSNGAGMVAGSWLDAQNGAHGFVYEAGAYRTFDMPKAASQVVVTAINDAGRVAGTYVSQPDNQQHGFLYNGSTVTGFGRYDIAVALSVAMNDTGKLVVSEQLFDGVPKFLSFLLTCSGSGC